MYTLTWLYNWISFNKLSWREHTNRCHNIQWEQNKYLIKAALEGKFIQPTAVLYYNSSQNEAEIEVLRQIWERKSEFWQN